MHLSLVVLCYYNIAKTKIATITITKLTTCIRTASPYSCYIDNSI